MKKNKVLCVIAVGLAGTLGAETVTRASLQSAIDTADARGGGKVVVPAGGRFMEGPLHLRSNVELADGAFFVKSGRDRDGWCIIRPTENVEIRNCRAIHSHTLLGIGSDLSAGIRGVRIHDCTVEDSVFRAFYIKTSRQC